MGPSVSVILPTYNRTRTLPAAIASVLNQSVGDFELVVVDDGSSEDVASLVRRHGDARTRYVRRPVNGGAAAARNTGIAEARGAFIAFQDSDDLWLPGKLERQLKLFDSLPADVGVVIGPKILYGRDSRMRRGPGKVSVVPDPRGRLSLDADQFGALTADNRLSVQCALFRRSCFAGGFGFDPRARANEDWELAVRLARRTRLYEDAEPVLLAFTSPDSISSDARRQAIGELRILINNRDLIGRYPRQRATMLRQVGRVLAATGKPRLARRLVLASLAVNPASASALAQAAGRRLLSRLVRQPGLAG